MSESGWRRLGITSKSLFQMFPFILRSSNEKPCFVHGIGLLIMFLLGFLFFCKGTVDTVACTFVYFKPSTQPQEHSHFRVLLCPFVLSPSTCLLIHKQPLASFLSLDNFFFFFKKVTGLRCSSVGKCLPGMH